jgi:carboxypeptidase Q
MMPAVAWRRRKPRAYYTNQVTQLAQHVLAMESDLGVFKPTGFGFTGPAAAGKTLRQAGALLEPLQAGTITSGCGAADLYVLRDAGVPVLELEVESANYFWYHHTDADTVDKVDPTEFNLCVAALAVMSFVIADLPEALAR